MFPGCEGRGEGVGRHRERREGVGNTKEMEDFGLSDDGDINLASSECEGRGCG